jgi:archaemetzincin
MPEAEAAAQAEALDLLALGSQAGTALEAIAQRLSRDVKIPCRTVPARSGLVPPRLSARDQVDAGALLQMLEASPLSAGHLLVGVTTEDLAIPIFTFVFGLGRQGGRVALVSLARADPAFYGLPPDPGLRDARAVDEIRHELGHVAGLEHCPDHTCLMSFAGSIERVDARGSQFCAQCAAQLPPWLRGVGPQHGFHSSAG